MILIVGLGNPGEKFQNTPHNIGFQIVECFRKENNFPEFKLAKKYNALISKGLLAQEKVLLMQPQTFMNNSGFSVKKIARNYKLQEINIWIIHDDIDILLGQTKIAKNRGAAGHKGVQSIINELGLKNFVRFRIGIGHDKTKKAEKLVLRQFTKEENKIVKQVIKKTIKALNNCLLKGIEETMQEYNK